MDFHVYGVSKVVSISFIFLFVRICLALLEYANPMRTCWSIPNFQPHVVLWVELGPSLVSVALLNSSYMELASLLGWWVGVWVGGVLWLLGLGCALGGEVGVLHSSHPKIWKTFSENINIKTSGSKVDYKIMRCINWSQRTFFFSFLWVSGNCFPWQYMRPP
jgi:hypothetical protein